MRTLFTALLLSGALALPGCATTQATQADTEAPAAAAPVAEAAHADMAWSDVKGQVECYGPLGEALMAYFMKHPNRNGVEIFQ